MIETLMMDRGSRNFVTKEEFKSEVLQWLKDAGITVEGIVVRPLKHKFSSCSEKGRLSFDNSLLEKPVKFRKEVVSRAVMGLYVDNKKKVSSALFKVFLGNRHLSN